jgi:hypothetical protein
MEKNYSSEDQSPFFDSTLSLPHFDEDATLLSARPVVPLHKLKAETRSRRTLIFGLTILTAILLGGIIATLLLMQSGTNSQSAEAEASQPTVSPSGAAAGSAFESAEAGRPIASEPDEEPKAREFPSARDSSIKKRPTASISRRSVKPARVGSPAHERDDDLENEDRELRRAERRDERREAKRQRRERHERRGDDLLRIREIFEGLPRP